MNHLYGIILALLAILPFGAHSSTHVETIEIGQFTAVANLAGVSGFTKKDGTNFVGCNQNIVYQAIPQLDPAVPPFQVTQEGLDVTNATIFLAKAMGSSVSVYYHIGTDGTCRYEAITVN